MIVSIENSKNYQLSYKALGLIVKFIELAKSIASFVLRDLLRTQQKFTKISHHSKILLNLCCVLRRSHILTTF